MTNFNKPFRLVKLKILASAIMMNAAAVTISFAQNANYGADNANKQFAPSQTLSGGKDDYQYLKLEDAVANSGVPLGGIGAGNVQFAPDGRFVRIGMNNIHIPILKSKACFFTIWSKTGNSVTVKRLVEDGTSQYGMAGISHTFYTGLFPRAEMSFSDDFKSVVPKICAWSGLVPQNTKDSSLPLVFFDVEIQAKETSEVAIAFSWEDFIGRGLREPKSIKGLDGQIMSPYTQNHAEFSGEIWPERKHIPTFCETWSNGNLSGVRQYATTPLIPVKATFQNYVDEVVVLAEQQKGAEISSLAGYDMDNGDAAWQGFAKNGNFNALASQKAGLSIPGGRNGASAMAVKVSMKAGEKKTIRFVLAWFYPELKIDRETASPESYWTGGSGYGRYFHNYFSSIGQLLNYGVANSSRILSQTKEWQEPILNSTLPDWYKLKLINSGYVIYTNMVLNKKGDVMVNEGGMGGLAGTMDQRISSHPFYQKFFTQIDRSERNIFGDAQALDGSINHFIGHYYDGMGTVGGRVPTEGNWMIDNTGGWIIQLAKDYEQTGDIGYLKRNIGRVKDGMSFLKSKMPKGLEIPIGPTTYDDFSHPPIYSYGSSIYLATLKATQAIANAVGDTAWSGETGKQFDRSQKEMIRMLWNGRFFSYGCELDGSKRLDNILFTGQLAGEFVSRYCGWGDILPMDMIQASLISQFKISLSKTPDYYANKVWDIDLGKGIDWEGSQCWPFYLESYTAYPAYIAGYVDDAMDIMKHIQLVHLRKGLTWCQNLWNPGDITYMTAPVSWFSTDLFAGAGVNIPRGELRIAPNIRGKEKVVLPLFYPTFWAVISLDPKTKMASLKITKTFGEDIISIRKLIVEPVGIPTTDRKEITINEFKLVTGAVLDLSPWWKEFAAADLKQPVLPNADKVEFLQVP